VRPVDPDFGSAAAADYDFIAAVSTFRVNANNTTTPIEQVTLRSQLYDVTFTFNVTQAAWQASGLPGVGPLKTSQVNEIAGHDHVIGVHGEEDIGTDGSLYNYLVVTVGTDDGERSQDVRIRMDHIGEPAAFAAIDRAWRLVQGLAPN
jgi:hypothetical protein